jgi:hypothetical protein
MPVFRYYNIQLLPTNTDKIGEVGEIGYSNLMGKLKNNVTEAVRAHQLKVFSFQLRNDMLFAPSWIFIQDSFSYGEFIKFDSAGEVKDLYTDELEFKGGPNSTSKKYSFRFVFDHARHIMAIQESDKSGRLPSEKVFIDALKLFFKPIIITDFYNYELKIIELSSGNALEAVFKDAVGYNRIEVEVTFANSDKFVDEVVSELKGKNVHSLVHIEKSASDGKMGLTAYSAAFLNTAKTYGNATISYVVKVGNNLKRKVFHMKDHPVRTNVVLGTKDSEDRYRMEILNSISAAEANSRRNVSPN